MSDSLTIIIISKNKEVRDLLQDDLSKFDYQILVTAEEKTAISLVRKNKPHLVFIDYKQPDLFGVDLLQLVTNEYPQTELIIITEQPIMEIIKQLSIFNRIFIFIEKPIDLMKIHLIINKFKEKNKEQIETKATLDDLFASYNQLEFLITILMNEFEVNSLTLKKTIDLFEATNLNQEQINNLSKLKGIFHNNDRLITRFNNMRSIDVSSEDFRKIDLVRLILDTKDELNLHSGCEVFLSDNLNNGEFFTQGTDEGLKILLSEVLYSLTIPMTDLCKKLSISLSSSDENLPNSYEIEIKSIIHKEKNEDDESIFDPSTQQYGFGYFLIKSLIDTFNGKLLLKDTMKDDYIETNMVIILPKYEK
ncbi:MAG: response regulator [Candidatus Heimdallarchaeota archaeon]|nr:response regulator [Candidatus Heimdallarchaeota archaeon]